MAPPFETGFGPSGELAAPMPPWMGAEPAPTPESLAPEQPPYEAQLDDGPGIDIAPYEALTNDRALDNHELVRQASLPTAEREYDAAERNRKKQEILETRMMAADAANAANEHENATDRLKSLAAADKFQASVQAEAEALGNERIDNNNWWHDRSLGQSILAFAAIAGGGWQSVKRGGRNVGLDIIQKSIDDDIETQAANLAHRRGMLDQKQGAVAQMYARTGDLFQAKEAVRLAGYGMAKQAALAEAQKFDPRGTAAQAKLQLAAEIDQRMRDAQLKAYDESQAREMTRLDIAKKRRDLAPKGPGKAKEPSFSDISSAAKENKQWVRNPAAPGGWALVPLGAPGEAPQLTDEERLKKANADEAEGKLVVRDSITGKQLGKADNTAKATAANEAQEAFHDVQKDLVRLKTLRKEIGFTNGMTGWLRGAENDGRVAEYETIRKRAAVKLAKLADPTSTVRENEEARALSMLPSYSSLLGDNDEEAERKFSTVQTDARANVKRAMVGGNISTFDPGSYYDDTGAPVMTPAQKAAADASAYVPADERGPKGKGAPAVDTGQLVAGPEGSTAPTEGGLEFLDVDSINPTIDSIENAPQGVRDLVAIALDPSAGAESAKAIDYLKALASDVKNPNAPAAKNALVQIGAK
jgi:hypothetical protein